MKRNAKSTVTRSVMRKLPGVARCVLRARLFPRDKKNDSYKHILHELIFRNVVDPLEIWLFEYSHFTTFNYMNSAPGLRGPARCACVGRSFGSNLAVT